MRTFSCSMRQRGIVQMISASKPSNIFSKTSVSHYFWSPSIKEQTFESVSSSCQKDNTLGEYFRGSHLYAHMSTNLPSPILHIAPFLMTSLPRIMLHHAYEAELGLAASMIVPFGKYLDLNTL